MKKEIPEQKKEYYAEILHMFKYNFKDRWAPESIFSKKNREWIRVFNKLIEEGFIEKRKSNPGYEYIWKSVFPY